MKLLICTALAVAAGAIGLAAWAAATDRVIRITPEQAEFASDVLVDINDLTREP